VENVDKALGRKNRLPPAGTEMIAPHRRQIGRREPRRKANSTLSPGGDSGGKAPFYQTDYRRILGCGGAQAYHRAAQLLRVSDNPGGCDAKIFG
jgi:hypothetical protein